MKSLKFALLAIAASLAVSSWAQAVVLYDESVSGDLATFDPITFNLSVGMDSVFGSSRFDTSGFDFWRHH